MAHALQHTKDSSNDKLFSDAENCGILVNFAFCVNSLEFSI